MNSLSVSYRMIYSVMHQFGNRKVDEKHPVITINLFLKDKFLINETTVLVKVKVPFYISLPI